MRSAVTSSAAGGVASTSGGSSTWKTAAPRRARAHAFGEARAHRDHGGGVAQRVPLERGRRPRQRAAAREAGLAQLIGDGRVHVHDQGQPEDAGQGRRQVRRLLDRVHDVEAAGQHPPRRLRHEGHVEDELGQRGPGRTCPTGKRRLRRWSRPGTSTVCALREREQLDVVPGRDQRAHHGQHGQRGAAHLEERLGGEEQDAQAECAARLTPAARPPCRSGSQSSVTCSPRKRSASMAAMQPLPAAVTAWR